MGRRKHQGLWRCPNSNCGKEFKQKQGLNNHKKSCGQKNFKCTICKKSFARNAYLKNHRCKGLVVSKQCNICFKSFDKLWHLERHMKSHVSKPIMNCHLCNRKYTRKDKFDAHISTCTVDQTGNHQNTLSENAIDESDFGLPSMTNVFGNSNMILDFDDFDDSAAENIDNLNSTLKLPIMNSVYSLREEEPEVFILDDVDFTPVNVRQTPVKVTAKKFSKKVSHLVASLKKVSLR